MIAIIGALDKEVDALLQLTNNAKKVEDSHPTHYLAKFYEHNIVIACSGVGKVEAAYTLTSLINQYDIELVINIGSAGGLQAGQQVGDVVVGKSFMYHDLIFDFNNPFEGLEKYDFTASQRNVDLMKQALDELKIRNWIGQIVSGDQFVHDKSQIDFILKRFPYAICCDMEATAMAHVCTMSQIEFIVIRSLSDITINDNSIEDFEKYLTLAARSSANACLLFLHKWKN